MKRENSKLRKMTGYFTKLERFMWCASVALIVGSFIAFDRESYLTLIASLVGVTSLIFNAKGNPIGQALTVLFSLIYGVISYSFAYYGEMLTYLGMTMPMAIFAFISWMRNPYEGRHEEVKVNTISRAETILMLLSAAAVTFGFYFVLDYFETANIVPSTISVTTSFLAVYLTFRRSPLYALAYAANDVVLIILWSLASAEDIRYLSVVVCFAAFLASDVYGFFSWHRMKKRQSGVAEP